MRVIATNLAERLSALINIFEFTQNGMTSYWIACCNAMVVILLCCWLNPLKAVWRFMFEPRKRSFVIDASEPFSTPYLKFDPLHSKLLLNGISSAPLHVDIVCVYELPASSWYQVRPHFECRLSTSKNIVQDTESE